MNNRMICYETKNIYISSVGQAQGNTYTVNLPMPVKDICRAELLYAEVPNSIYNISSGASSFQIDGGSALTIPNGFYTPSDLATEITNAVNTSGFSVVYLSSEGKFLFTNAYSFSVTFDSPQLQSVMGFTNATNNAITGGVYANNARYKGKYYLKSDTLANMQTNQSIFLDIEELRSITVQGGQGTNSNGGASPLIVGPSLRTFAIVPMDVTPGTYKQFKGGSDFLWDIEYPYPIMNLSKLTIRWTDIFGNLISFNGMETNSIIVRLYTKVPQICSQKKY